LSPATKQKRPVQESQPLTPGRIEALDIIQRRVVWLASRMIHHANHERPNPEGTKVGGHQASSTSIASILTALYFHYLRPGDRVAVKPQSSPAFHAVQYLLGRLPREYMTRLRSYGGLQPYPSRTKDPDGVDFSTGSVGLGAVAPAFCAAVYRYAQAHFGPLPERRFVALMGDAEMDEGNVWEALLDDSLQGLHNLLWIVDLNRQSLDRVVPGIRAVRLKRLFEDMGWQVIEAKYGRKLQDLFGRPGGEALRRRIDRMLNEEYQAMIRQDGAEIRRHLLEEKGQGRAEMAHLLENIPDGELPALLSNLGGHDMEELLLRLAEVDDRRPTILFAYTIKGWGLPLAGHPLNHAQLMSPEQIEGLRVSYGIPSDDDWPRFDEASAEGGLCAERAGHLFGGGENPPFVFSPNDVPGDIHMPSPSMTSTQDTFGRLLVQLADQPGLARHIVTTSPDVSISTNLAGWINKTGVFSPREQKDYEDAEVYRLLKWHRSPRGQHIELGISEMNLFMMLSMMGLSTELCGVHLIPIGTVYDPFVCRGLDALIYGLYSGSKFIVAGTPSGVTLSPEGGSHQSTVTPSLGTELPELDYWEPCFALELKWILLESIRQCCDRAKGRSSYLRLSTRPVDQGLMNAALGRLGEDALSRQVLSGACRLRDWRDRGAVDESAPLVILAAAGALIPEALAAADMLEREGTRVNVLGIASPRRLYDRWQSCRTGYLEVAGSGREGFLGELILPQERRAPIVTVQDGASHSLAWLGSVFGTRTVSLGVDRFGQTGSRADLYRHFGIDAAGIAEAAFSLLEICDAGQG
jgi:pyruvate dehydrogenase E1 component